jgi:hypothetical protein
MKEGGAAGNIPGGQGFELLLCFMFLKEGLCRGGKMDEEKKRIRGGGRSISKSRPCGSKKNKSLMQAKVDGTSKRNSSSSSMAVQCVAFLFLSFYYFFSQHYFLCPNGKRENGTGN